MDPTIVKNNEEHTKLLAQVKALQDEYGKTDTTVERKAAIDEERAKLLDAADALQTDTESRLVAAEKKAELDRRMGDHERFLNGSAGRLPGMSRGGSETKAGPVEVKGDYVGATVSVKGDDGRSRETFVGVYGRDDYERRPELKASATDEYAAAFRAYLRATSREQIPGGTWDVLARASAKALTEGTDSAGGFLVPIPMLARIIVAKPGAAVMTPPRVTNVPTSGPEVLVPRLKAATTDSTMYSSAVAVTDVGETPAAATGETNPVFEQVRMRKHGLKLLTKLSRWLVADTAVSLDGLLADEFGKALALGKDDRYLTGNGVNQPMGIVNDSAITHVVSGHASQLTADGLKDLFYALAAQYQQSASWVLSLSALKAVRKLKDGSGNYMWDAGSHGLENGVPPTIEGRPYQVSDFLDTVGAGNFPLFVGDLSAYWTTDDPGLGIEVLRELYADQNLIGYQAIHRYGGIVTNPAAFRVQTVSA